MDRKPFPEMVQLILRTLTISIKKGILIANEWHYAAPADPHQPFSPVDAFQRRKDLIMSHTANDALVYSQVGYLNIQSLTVTDASEGLCGGDSQDFAPSHMFPTLPMLEHLGLESVQPNKINWFLRPVFAFPCLRSLVLTDTVLDREGALLLWMVFPQLEVLSLMDVHFPDMEAVLQNMNGMLCPRLAKLYLHYNNGGFPLEYQYQLLMACPSLVAFHWTLPNGNEKHVFSGGFRDLCEFYHPERYRETEELHIVGEMDDYGIALAMNIMKGVKSLSLCVDNRIGIASLYAIRNMAANLRRFESHSYLMTCATIETILSSCPLLHTMIARTMSALYATKEKRREWICAPSLKVLCLSFVFESHEAHLQDEMYEKLARLTQLEHLIMNEPCDDRPGRFGLRLRLDQGLGRLSTLTNLTFLSTLDDFSHPCRMQELAWMGKHWPLLREYHCAPSGRSVIHNK